MSWGCCKLKKFETKAIHIGQEPEKLYGSVSLPIYQSSTFKQFPEFFHEVHFRSCMNSMFILLIPAALRYPFITGHHLGTFEDPIRS